MKFIIGSMNNAKVEAARQVIHTYYENAQIIPVKASSGVSGQPIGDEETLEGAVNRASFIRKSHPTAIGIGLEGGVRMLGDQMYICNWGALSLPSGQVITAGGAQIRLPDEIAEEIKKGRELGPVIEDFFNEKGLRQKEGAMGVFTNGAITRVDLFTHIMQLLIGQLTFMVKQGESESEFEST